MICEMCKAFLIGNLNDQTQLLVWPSIYKSILLNYGIYANIFHPFSHPLTDNQPFFALIVSFLLKIFGVNGLFILTLLSVLLLFVFSYLLFKKEKFGLVYALLYTFAPYVMVQAGDHLDLLQIWTIPAFFLLLKKYDKSHDSIQHIILGS